MKHRAPWRRRHTRLLVRLWDKDFNHIHTLTDDHKVEPWSAYLKRIARLLTPWWLIASSPLLLIPIGLVS